MERVGTLVECESKEGVDTLFKRFTDWFSKKFGWVADRYGVSWRLNFSK